MRVIVGGLWHETNTFAAGLTTLEHFRAYQHAEGSAMLSRYKGTGTELGGMIAAAESLGVTLIPSIYGGAVPSGTIARFAFESIAGVITQTVRGEGIVDGILLALHGAGVAEGVDDVEGEIIARVRNLVGPTVPIAVTLDYHANIGPAMVEGADILIGYDTYPHTDMAQRGDEAMRLLHRMATTGQRPKRAHVKIPLLTSPLSQQSGVKPLDGIYAALHAAEKEHGIWSGTLAMGFAFADIPHLGASVLFYANDEAQAQRSAKAIADLVWSERNGMAPQLRDTEAAVADALSGDAPAILVDAADNVGGGSPGDGTALLATLLAKRAEGAVVVIADAEAAARAVAAGQGASFTAGVGGKQDGLHGAPVQVKGTVAAVFPDARYIHTGSYMTGYETVMGQAAVIEAQGVKVVLTEQRTMPFDAGQLRCVGIDPGAQKIIVVKSAIAWRAAYGDVAKRIIIADTPGVCAANLSRFAYAKRPKPVFPLDPDATFTP